MKFLSISAVLQGLQARLQSTPDLFRARVPHHVSGPGFGAFALLALSAPQLVEAAPTAPTHEPPHVLEVGLDRQITSGGWASNLTHQIPSHRLRSRVEFLSDVPLQCESMPHKEPHKECEKGDPWGLKKFRHEHPTEFNVLLAIVTLLVGVLIGGGLL